MRLDLGAVAKGFAVDLVAESLQDLPSVAINAGGDLYCRGRNLHGRPWSVGIRDPFRSSGLLLHIDVDGLAVCTSGSYERRLANGGHHLIDPARGASAQGMVSCTVAGERAAIADALATAAFIMGPDRAIPFLTDQQVDALLVDEAGYWHTVHAGQRVRFPEQRSALPPTPPSA
ncbi:MAG TPA: FAD:protein FMN transferase, partial [Gemmatimonas sp.]|uniref:FAD:protein FMN transferase n=1 Tax=Gemmatimonas sp. TaxID=1962908 RepID=UPI002ED9E20F